MCAEDVWRLPQSVRDGWRGWAERASESHRVGWLLITGGARRPGTLVFSLHACPFSLGLSSIFFFPSDPSHRLVQDAHHSGTTTAHISLPFLFPLVSSFLFFLSIQRKGYPCNSGVAGKRTAPGAMPPRATNSLTKSMLAGPAAREFLSISVVIYQLGFFIV